MGSIAKNCRDNKQDFNQNFGKALTLLYIDL